MTRAAFVLALLLVPGCLSDGTNNGTTTSMTTSSTPTAWREPNPFNKALDVHYVLRFALEESEPVVGAFGRLEDAPGYGIVLRMGNETIRSPPYATTEDMFVLPRAAWFNGSMAVVASTAPPGTQVTGIGAQTPGLLRFDRAAGWSALEPLPMVGPLSQTQPLDLLYDASGVTVLLTDPSGMSLLRLPSSGSPSRTLLPGSGALHLGSVARLGDVDVVLGTTGADSFAYWTVPHDGSPPTLHDLGGLRGPIAFERTGIAKPADDTLVLAWSYDNGPVGGDSAPRATHALRLKQNGSREPVESLGGVYPGFLMGSGGITVMAISSYGGDPDASFWRLDGGKWQPCAPFASWEGGAADHGFAAGVDQGEIHSLFIQDGRKLQRTPLASLRCGA